jgi:hypothetical protein
MDIAPVGTALSPIGWMLTALAITIGFKQRHDDMKRSHLVRRRHDRVDGSERSLSSGIDQGHQSQQDGLVACLLGPHERSSLSRHIRRLPAVPASYKFLPAESLAQH